MDTVIAWLVNGVVVPVTSLIPLLVSSGMLFAVFAALWAGFGVALVRDQARLDRAWATVRRQPLLVQGLAWLLALPVLVGLRIWRARWPLVARLVMIAGLAGWNLLVMLPTAA